MEREPQITFKNIPTSDALEQLIRERIGRLEKFHHHIMGVRVVIEVPHAAPNSGKNALAISVEVDVAGRPRIVVKRSEEDHESKGDRYAFMNCGVRRGPAPARRYRRQAERRGQAPQHPGRRTEHLSRITAARGAADRGPACRRPAMSRG